MKRVLDVFLSLSAIVVLAVPMIVIAGLVAASSPGGVIFRQTRVGQNGALFQILKFRTMRSSGQGPLVTRSGDPRVTPIGAVLRRLKVDELPQLFNVLKGEMSLVGPRPEVPRYVEKYTEAQRAVVLSVRPGITDLAAIHFRDEESMLASAGKDTERVYVENIMPIKLRFYMDYINNRSNVGDLKILFATFKAVLKLNRPGPRSRVGS